MKVLSLLAATGLCAIGPTIAQTQRTTRPDGALSGKVVYLHPGHGWTSENLINGMWFTQRPETFEIVEDLLNQDFITYQADDLWRAGATIVPLRPIGDQTNEVIIDNDDITVTFEGDWFDSSSPIFFGDAGDVPYRFAFTSQTESRTATYRPMIPQDGFYPVYAWTLGGTNRVDQLYRVTHSGGTTDVRIDHRLVGGGLVYLGTYHFEEGNSATVVISNNSTTDGVVIADMIRFGNGVGDIDRGAGVSGKARQDEAGLYWIERHLGQGIPTSEYRSSTDDGSATVSAPTRWAEWMNLEQTGALSDRVFLSHHSNAAGGAARGVIALANGNNDPATETPNQFLLAQLLAAEINNDMEAAEGAGLLEHPWSFRTFLVLDRLEFEFGEINNLFINDEFDATIVERGFHDNQLDAELMRDPRVNEQMAASTTQGLIRYFRTVDNGVTPLVFAPPRVTGVAAITNPDGSVTVSWNAPTPTSYAGDAPNGYTVFKSKNGFGFDAGTHINNPAATSLTIPTSSMQSSPTYFRVAAVNPGGQGPWSSVVAVRPRTFGTFGPTVLIVDGFDRLDRFQNPREQFGFGDIDRVRPRLSNSFDYALQVAESLVDFSPAVDISTTTNERVIDGSVSLSDADMVVWILGEESSAGRTFNTAEQSAVQSFLSAGGHLFVSGAEIGWDLDAQGGGFGFLTNVLSTEYLADDAQTYAATGTPGSLFEGIDLDFDFGSTFYDVRFPDVLAPRPPASSAMTYATGGSASITREPSASLGGLVLFGFPFEAILDPLDREDIMHRSIEFLGFVPNCSADFELDGSIDQPDLAAFIMALVNNDASINIAAPLSGQADFLDLLLFQHRLEDCLHE